MIDAQIRVRPLELVEARELPHQKDAMATRIGADSSNPRSKSAPRHDRSTHEAGNEYIYSAERSNAIQGESGDNNKCFPDRPGNHLRSSESIAIIFIFINA